jgi:predicted RNA-binding protein (virulence factor B family)
MAEIGVINQLRVVKELDFGIYLDGGDHGEILMPKRYVPENCKIDDVIDAFIYRDSEDRIIATTERPLAMIGEFAYLKVVSISTVGAFLDWGLPKDILVPYREQRHNMEVGKKYIVRIYLDHDSERVVASTKIDKFLDNLPPEFTDGQEVDLFIVSKTDIGYKAIINNSHFGMLYQNEVFQTIKQGQRIKGFIKKVREDEKIDLCLEKPGYEKLDSLAEKILEILKDNEGFLSVTDKSDPEKIYKQFGASKKSYKKAVGALYKQRLINIEEFGIRLI